MYRSILIVGGTCTVLAGCATVPDISSFELPISEVVGNIKCEVRNTVWDFDDVDNLIDKESEARSKIIHSVLPRYSWFKNQTVSAAFTLKVAQNNEAGGDVSFTFPLMPGVATLSPEGKTSTTVTRTETFSIGETLSEKPVWETGSAKIIRNPKNGATSILEKPKKLKSLKFTKLCDGYNSKTSGRRLLAGELGLRAFFDRLNDAKTNTDVSLSDLTYTADFLIVSSSGIGPRFTMIPLNSDTFAGGFKLASKRDDTHSVKLSFSALSPFSKEFPISAVYDLSGTGSLASGFDTPRKTDLRTIRGKPSAPTSGIPDENKRLNDILIDRQILRELDTRLTN